ncbi:MAG: D-alanine--D-alanine ligase [Planctomycetes bacterium]|nr:D-alanine--D-alanine ligase [Planctomycetota bacterium]
MGGISPEREVSLRSGKAVAQALKNAGFNVFCIDVKDEKIEELDHREIDVAFIALHGYFGEDGRVQHLLESKGIPYTGSGVNASKIAMDKLATKKCFVNAGLKTPDYLVVTEFQECAEIQRTITKFGLPVVLKPPQNGSSIGISIIRDINDLKQGLTSAFKFGYELLIEKYVKGRELTIGILDDKALPIIEIKPSAEFFNYEAKYRDNKTEYLVVEPEQKNSAHAHEKLVCRAGALPLNLYAKAQKLAEDAHRVLGCKGFSRVDMLMNEEGEFYLLEINTIPGFTEKSLLPKAAHAAGISFPSLCRKIAELAVRDVLVSANMKPQTDTKMLNARIERTV